MEYADLEIRILEKETNGCSVEINLDGELEFPADSLGGMKKPVSLARSPYHRTCPTEKGVAATRH